MRSVESKDLLERRWPGVGYALFEELGHRVLPPLGDRLPGEVGRRGFEVVRLEVAEDLVAVAEDGVVADAGAAERVEHLGPDLAVGGDVVVDPLRRIRRTNALRCVMWSPSPRGRRASVGRERPRPG